MRYLCFFLSVVSLLFASETPVKRASPLPMTTAVIVPCTAFHFSLLRGLLESYTRQSCLPDEISISLSDCQNLDRSEIRKLENERWPFQLKLFCHRENKTAGENRNWARIQSRGDIIICQDADDIPHPQRVEIVKFLFENYDIEHLVHSYAPGGRFVPYDKAAAPLFELTKLRIFEGFQEEGRTVPLHNGNICLRRDFAQRIRWDNIHDGQEDVRFNNRVCEISRKTYLTPLGLIHFVDGRSYFRDRPQ